MNFELSEAQQLLQESFGKLFRQESTPLRVRAAEASGIDSKLWAELLKLGAVQMRAPEPLGGGLSLLDAQIIVEEAGRHLAMVPLIEGIVSARLLALVGGKHADALLDKQCRGEAIVTVALRETDDRRQLVPSAAVATTILWLSGEQLLSSEAGSATPTRFLGALPNSWESPADDGTVKLGSGSKVRELYAAALHEWHMLTCAFLIGAADQSLRIAANYARERHAFGKPIGSFQGVSHPLADSVTEVDGARLLCWRASAAIRGRAASSLSPGALIALAYWFATQVAARAATRAMRVFGGYGMTLEYDIQLYFRRIRGLSLIAGDPEEGLVAAGAFISDQSQTALPDPGEIDMDFRWGSEADSLLDEVRRFFVDHLEPDTSNGNFAYHSEDAHDPALFQRLAHDRLLYPEWPSELGGRACSLSTAAAMQEAMIEAGIPILVPVVTDMVGKMLIEFGSEGAKAELLPKFANGTAYCSLGYSEPSGGSDVFAAKSRAVKDGDEWIVNAQKMFTTQGHLADYALMLLRTDLDAAKHAGLTLFIVPLRQTGYEAQNVKTIGNERTNITYYTDMRVPDRYRLGEVNGGSRVMASALKLEQGVGLYNVGPMRRLLKHALAWSRTDDGAGLPLQRSNVRARLARVACAIEVADALTRRSIWASEQRCGQKWYGSMSKLFGSEAWLAGASDLMELAAPFSLECGPTDPGWIEIEYRRALPSTIYGGTSEIHRSIIAESALGLPRSRS